MKKSVVNMDSVFATTERMDLADKRLSWNAPPSKRYDIPETIAFAESSAHGPFRKNICRYLPSRLSSSRQTSITEQTGNSKNNAVRKFTQTTLGGIRYKTQQSHKPVFCDRQTECPRSTSSSKEGSGNEELERSPTKPNQRKSFSDLVGALGGKKGSRNFREPVTPGKGPETCYITPIYPKNVDYGEHTPTRQHITIVDRRLDDSFRRTQKHSAPLQEDRVKLTTNDDTSIAVFQEEKLSGNGQASVSSPSQIKDCFDPIFYFLPWHSRSLLYDELFEETGQRIPDQETDYLQDFYPEFPNHCKVLRERYLEVYKQPDMRRIQQDIKLVVQKMADNQSSQTVSMHGEGSNSIRCGFENNEEDFWNSIEMGTAITREIKFDSRLKRIHSYDLDKVSWVDKILQDTKRLRRPAQRLGLTTAWIEEILDDSVDFRTPREKCNRCRSYFDEDGTENKKLPSTPAPARNSPVDIQEIPPNIKRMTPRLWSINQNMNCRENISSTESNCPSLWTPDQRYHRYPTTPVHEEDSDHSNQSEPSCDSESFPDGPLDGELALGNIVSSRDEDVMRQGSAEKQWCVLSDLQLEDALPLPTWVDLGKGWRRKNCRNIVNFENLHLDECETHDDWSDDSDANGAFQSTEVLAGGRKLCLTNFFDRMLAKEKRIADGLASRPDMIGLPASEQFVRRENGSAIQLPQVTPDPKAGLTPEVVLKMQKKSPGKRYSSGDTVCIPMPDIDHCAGFKFSELGCILVPDHSSSVVRNLESYEASKDMASLAMSSDEPCNSQKEKSIYLAAEGSSMPGVTTGKVGHLINVFQAHGIIPDPKPNFAPTRSPFQSGHSKRIFFMASSEESSSSDHSPTTQSDRPISRLSNQETEFSSTFGEELERAGFPPFGAAGVEE